ncbi:GrBNV_gp84-like protein [Oryctes rhinoceros nudivirus]|uniref:GrBNV_gp84-like protein n=1 Tax=Oryctes rhinoceros nudivirus TaxID=92521 RepID=A3QTZ6_9VIRU|nr:GrBNV_gp84-like protein [Oryctes rhinoceros nudivirus]ABF93319.1 unknown [Oryctes rhinoceros nudivirus]ACH96183.1 GrBNV_gp84-like protein [Oryctes rhinoceros nudivirus]QHG11290.1 GrBNV_gp84-like protein [Oryctes rhinoceros nudivirus]QKE59524.1 GrBNV_gp84-like protein [Oryctes rhinoceros nudivirus]UBO76471.1 GrBNV_gp84-like protein [Oryctes rhinoceros nudivirus]
MYKMSFIQNLKRKAIDTGKLFVVSKESTESKLKAPKPQCGFQMSFIAVQHLRCQIEVDHKAVVSLALVNQKSPILESYANKLPIMTINVARLLFTIEAFTLKNKDTFRKPPVQQALEFYIRTDLKHRSKKLPPNHQFSQFLHRLKSSGYPEYIFDLAREVELNVDYIIDSKIAARYIRTEGEPEKRYSPSIGYLTAIHEPNNEWYVKTTQGPILA